MDEIVVHKHITETIKNLAKMSDHHFKVGAVIVKGRRVIAGGHNKNKTHTIIKNRIDKYSLVDKIHAEMNAILKARTDLSGTKIYVLRVDSKNKTGMSRPCGLCMRLIREAGIRSVIYTTGDLEQPWAMEKIYKEIDV